MTAAVKKAEPPPKPPVANFCTCSDQGLEPYWYQFADGRIGCKRCRLPHAVYAPPIPGHIPPDMPTIEHELAAAVILAGVLQPKPPEPPP